MHISRLHAPNVIQQDLRVFQEPASVVIFRIIMPRQIRLMHWLNFQIPVKFVTLQQAGRPRNLITIPVPPFHLQVPILVLDATVVIQTGLPEFQQPVSVVIWRILTVQ